ncbi:MAG: porin family protein [Gammaproteobacteria bacterium]|nr:porin family protein [Gammaproteobacteria bacterium]
MNRIFGIAVLLLLQCAAFAQNTAAPAADLSYTYGELRFVDYDENGGDGFRINGSYDLGNNWIILGGYTTADFNNNVDADILEIGGGYVWSYTPDWDLVATARFVNADFDTPGGSSDESGLAISGGTRGFLAPKFELRGSVNYINLDDSDTYLELAGDYYFTRQFSAGVSLEFAGDTDLFSIGARYFFR